MNLTEAMLAVAQHAVDYSLPPALAIHQPAPGRNVVEVSVAPHALTEWLDSIFVERETAAPVSSDLERLRGCERVCFTGVLTSARGDVAVELRSVRKIVAHLLGVPA